MMNHLTSFRKGLSVNGEVPAPAQSGSNTGCLKQTSRYTGTTVWSKYGGPTPFSKFCHIGRTFCRYRSLLAMSTTDENKIEKRSTAPVTGSSSLSP